MNKTLRYFSLWYLQAVGVIAAACAGFAVGALLEIRSSGAGLLSTYLSSVPIMVLLLSLVMPYTMSRNYAEEALCFGAARREIFRGLETATLLYALVSSYLAFPSLPGRNPAVYFCCTIPGVTPGCR